MSEDRKKIIAKLIKIKALAERAKVFFVQKEFANGNISSVAESTGTVMTEIDPLGYDWQKEMVKVARCLR